MALHRMRRKSDPAPRRLSMMKFYLNRAGGNLSDSHKRVLERAKDELPRLYGKSSRRPPTRGNPLPDRQLRMCQSTASTPLSPASAVTGGGTLVSIARLKSPSSKTSRRDLPLDARMT